MEWLPRIYVPALLGVAIGCVLAVFANAYALVPPIGLASTIIALGSLAGAVALGAVVALWSLEDFIRWDRFPLASMFVGAVTAVFELTFFAGIIGSEVVVPLTFVFGAVIGLAYWVCVRRSASSKT